MNTELATALIDEIRFAHNEAQDSIEAAKQGMHEAVDKCCNVGLLLEGAKQQYKSRYEEWCRLALNFMSKEQHDTYLTVVKVRRTRTAIYLDPRQLKLMGVLGDDSVEEHGGTSTGQRSDGSRAIKWLSHVEQHIRELDAQRPIETWEPFERKAWADMLTPMVALFKRVGGVV